MTKKQFGHMMVCIMMLLVLFYSVNGAPMPSGAAEAYLNEFPDTPDDLLIALVDRFGETIMKARKDLENSKRTVDFGLARGFSGTLEARHRMGLAAANFPGGPGRRRRAESDN